MPDCGSNPEPRTKNFMKTLTLILLALALALLLPGCAQTRRPHPECVDALFMMFLELPPEEVLREMVKAQSFSAKASKDRGVKGQDSSRVFPVSCGVLPEMHDTARDRKGAREMPINHGMTPNTRN